MEYTKLKDVNETSQQWTVRARVVRFCRYLSPDDPTKIRRLDLVLLDEEGTAMDGQIPETWVPSFLSKLTEGSVYYIKYFQVRNARDLYRPVDHLYLMRFTAHTKVYEIKPIPAHFPQYAYSLATFEVLNTRIDENAYCSDTIGVLKGCSHVKLQNTSKGTRPLRNVYIVNDSGETAVIALWGNQANEFEAERYIEISNQGPVVFLFVGVTCRRFDGKLSLQGSTLCRWYANPEIPEAMTLHNSCVGRTAPATWYGPTAGQAAPERIMIQDLAKFTNPHTIYSNRYIVNAKIISLLPDQSWWYLACNKCNRRTEMVDCAYRCKTYKCTGNDGGPRYSVAMSAKDPMEPTDGQEPASIQLVFFGPTAEELIGVPVDTLISTHGSQTNFLPTRITSLYGRQFELRISVSPRSLQRQHISYQVDTILGVTNQPLQLPIPHTIASQQTPQIADSLAQRTQVHEPTGLPVLTSSSQETTATPIMVPTTNTEDTTALAGHSTPEDLPAQHVPATSTDAIVAPPVQSTPPPQELDHAKQSEKGTKRQATELANMDEPKSSRKRLDLKD